MAAMINRKPHANSPLDEITYLHFTGLEALVLQEDNLGLAFEMNGIRFNMMKNHLLQLRGNR